MLIPEYLSVCLVPTASRDNDEAGMYGGARAPRLIEMPQRCDRDLLNRNVPVWQRSEVRPASTHFCLIPTSGNSRGDVRPINAGCIA